jgi:uncharacterized lipoprotein
MTAKTAATLAFAGLLAGLTAACSSDDPRVGPAPQPISQAERELQQAGVQGSIFDLVGGVQAGNVRLGNPEDALGVSNVNKHIWRAALDTLSFMPIASTDPFTGVIATDWASTAGAPNERLKATVFVTSTALSAQSLRVAVYREVLQNGAWVAAPVADETPRKIEDAILVRARQLRIAEAEANAQG